MVGNGPWHPNPDRLGGSSEARLQLTWPGNVWLSRRKPRSRQYSQRGIISFRTSHSVNPQQVIYLGTSLMGKSISGANISQGHRQPDDR